MTRYFVLWHNASGIPVWNGPFETFEEASSSTPMRDRHTDAFVTMTGNWREPQDVQVGHGNTQFNNFGGTL